MSAPLTRMMSGMAYLRNKPPRRTGQFSVRLTRCSAGRAGPLLILAEKAREEDSTVARSRQVRGLPDHLVRAQQQRLPDRQPEGLGGLQVDREPVLGRLLDRKIARIGASQNLVDVLCGTPKQ